MAKIRCPDMWESQARWKHNPFRLREDNSLSRVGLLTWQQTKHVYTFTEVYGKNKRRHTKYKFTWEKLMCIAVQIQSMLDFGPKPSLEKTHKGSQNYFMLQQYLRFWTQ